MNPVLKGDVGEAKVALWSLLTLPPPTYARFNDVTLRVRDGTTTQIDHVFVSKFGVFVVETKNMSGRIYGAARDRQWTQVFPSCEYPFQNPLRQNHRHVKAVEELLGRQLSAGSVRSVVAFVGDAQLMSGMPANVTTGRGWARHVRSFGQPVLSADQVRGACAAISSARLPPVNGN